MKIGILNTTILTNDGEFGLKTITLEQAKSLMDLNSDNFVSAVGHEATALVLSTLLGQKIPMNRIQFKQEIGQTCLCFKLNERIEEGKILTVSEIEKIGYEFKLLKMRNENE